MYFFTDFCGNYIRTFDPSVPGSVGTPDRSNDFATDLTSGGVVDLKVDSDGIYIICRAEVLERSIVSPPRPW